MFHISSMLISECLVHRKVLSLAVTVGLVTDCSLLLDLSAQRCTWCCVVTC